MSKLDEAGTSDADEVNATPERPLLQIVTSDVTEEEVAAIVAVVSALGTTAAPAPRKRREWAAAYRQVRVANWHGRGGWQSSALPKHRGR